MRLIKDLFHRRVPQVAAIYFGACWGLVEFVDFATQRFALSPHLVDLTLVGPLLLLPSVILVTYFHGARGKDEWMLAEKIGIPTNLVVAALFLFVFFQGKDLGAATTTVVVTDEEGVEAERVIPKFEFRKRLTLFFFDAEAGDTATAWIQYGLPIALANDLAQDHFLDLRLPVLFTERLREAGFERLVNVPLPLAREIAEEQHRDHFVLGSVALVDGQYRATVSLYDTGRGQLVNEAVYSFTDLMEVADRISLDLREALNIPDLGQEGPKDLPAAELLTGSLRAYRLSVEATMASLVDRDFARATDLMEEAVAEDPTYADGQFALARLYMVTNRPAEIAGPLQASMDHIYRLPERSRFVVKSDFYFLLQQDTDRAMAALDMWADLFPDDVQAYEARLQIQFLRDDKDGALSSLQTILELDQARRDVLIQIGDIRQAKGDFPAAKAAFQEYAEEFPEDHQVLIKLAGLARRMGNLDEAREHYDRALLLAPSNVGLMVGLGTVEQASGNFETALTQYETAMEAAGTPEERAQVFSALESYYAARGQIARSIETMEERLEESSGYQPGFIIVQQRLMEAGTYAEVGRMEEAWALVEAARTQLTPPFDAMAPLGEMDIYLALEDADRIEATAPAVESFIETLQYEIVRPALLAAQGEAKALRGEYREAIQFFEEQRRLAPNRTSAIRNLGRCHRELGEYDQAVAQLQEALAVSPSGGRTNYELALTYEAMGRMEEARTHIGRALEVWAEADPGYKWAQRAREAAARIGG